MNKTITDFLNVFQPRVKSNKAEPSDKGLNTAFNLHREKSKHGSICFAPSVNMLFAMDGTVKACCHNSENSLGRYPEKTISEIWNSEEAKDFRQKMGEYQLLSGCHGCAADYRLEQFDQMPSMHFDTLPQHEHYPSMMEFLWSNTCNLECVMCSGGLSSSIRKNREHLPPIKTPYDKEFIRQLQEFVPYLVETRFSGAGEAFSIDMNFQFWEMLIERNPACKIVVQTNGTVLNAKVRDFLSRGNFQIGVSLDSLNKDIYESIRLNASFENVMSNIEYFSTYSNQHQRPFTISTCIMRQNWHELPDFVKFCNRLGAHATFHKVWTPLAYALYNLPANELFVIYNQLASVQLPETNTLERKNRNHYNYFVSVIKEWMNAATNKKKNITDIEKLTTEQLKIYIKTNLADYVYEQSMLETDKKFLVELCHRKIDGVAELWVDETKRRNMLLHLTVVPINEILPTLKINTVEKLFEMSTVSMNR